MKSTTNIQKKFIISLLLLSLSLCTITIKSKETPDAKTRKSMKKHLLPKPPKRSPPPIIKTEEYNLLRSKIMNSNIFNIAKSYLPKT